MKSYVRKFDLKEKDIPRAILVHELLGISILLVTWSTCYYNPLSQNPMLEGPIAKIKGMMPMRIQNFASSIKIPFINVGEVKSKLLTSSYIEASCIRKIIRPFTIPTKLWITYNIVKGFPNNREGSVDILKLI